VEREVNGVMEPTIKISANPEKVTTPGKKDVYRIVDRGTGKAIADYMCFPEEPEPREGRQLKLFNPLHTYIRRYVKNYEALSMLVPIFEEGRLVYDMPSLDEARDYHASQLKLFWPQYLRKLNPEIYRVNISEKAWNLKQGLIDRYMEENEAPQEG